MSDTRPAVNDEQWDELLETGSLHTDGGLVARHSDAGIELAGAASHPTDRHALAALALHGQPFGFTREDVTMLRHAEIADYRGDFRRALDSIADRIEALLPPNE